MDMSAVITLLQTAVTTTDSGTQKTTITQRRSAFCQISSVGSRESYQALAVGHEPTIKATIAAFEDYNGENFVLYDGAVYKVLRTYRTRASIELTLEQTDDLEGLI